MSTSLLRVVERAQQDAEQGPEAIQSNGLRRVSAPPTPTGRGPARSAHETLGRTLQLLRSERQPSKSGPSGSRHATGLAKMAAPSQPAHASHVGAVQPIVGTLPASPAAGCRADMGGVATRHISGGAGWWKSPCPVLVRASGEQSPGGLGWTHESKVGFADSSYRHEASAQLVAMQSDNVESARFSTLYPVQHVRQFVVDGYVVLEDQSHRIAPTRHHLLGLMVAEPAPDCPGWDTQSPRGLCCPVNQAFVVRFEPAAVDGGKPFPAQTELQQPVPDPFASLRIDVEVDYDDSHHGSRSRLE